MATTINDWPIEHGFCATFGPDDFERWWLSGMSLSDKFTNEDIEELLENCVYIARSEGREMTQGLDELRSEILSWQEKWNSKIDEDA